MFWSRQVGPGDPLCTGHKVEILRRENYPAAPYDAKVGISPMVKIGNMVFIGATSSTNVQGDVEGGGDPYRQAKIIFKKINEANYAVSVTSKSRRYKKNADIATLLVSKAISMKKLQYYLASFQ